MLPLMIVMLHLTVTSLTADQHYLVSVSAINEVGTSQSTQEIEICEYLTTKLLYEVYNMYLLIHGPPTLYVL